MEGEWTPDQTDRSDVSEDFPMVFLIRVIGVIRGSI
jgi:hypothetical protein